MGSRARLSALGSRTRLAPGSGAGFMAPAHFASGTRARTMRPLSGRFAPVARASSSAPQRWPAAAPTQDVCTGHGEMRPYCAPLGLRTARPPWVGLALLLSFSLAALAIHLVLPRLTFDYGRLVGMLAGVHRFGLPKQASIAVRPLTIAILVIFAACAAGSVRARVRLALTALIIYLPLMLAVDVVLARLAR